MPAFVEVYSDRMRAALFRDVLDGRRPVTEALRRAREGALPDLDPADQTVLAGMNYGFAAQLVREERERRQIIPRAAGQVRELVHETALRLAHLADREARRLAVSKAKVPVDTGAGIGAGKLAREALAIIRDLEAPNAKGNGKPSADGPETKPKRPLTLPEQIAAAQGPVASETTHPTTVEGEEALRAEAPTDNAPNRSAEPAHARAVLAARVA